MGKKRGVAEERFSCGRRTSPVVGRTFTQNVLQRLSGECRFSWKKYISLRCVEQISTLQAHRVRWKRQAVLVFNQCKPPSSPGYLPRFEAGKIAEYKQ